MSVDHCSLDEYLLDPCRASSLPYWKAKSISIPDHMKIVHHENFDPNAWTDFCDDTYFRLRHDLQDMTAPCPIDGFSICDISIADYATHINFCYSDMGISEGQLQEYIARPVYHPLLWLAIQDKHTGQIVATGIGELDGEVGEGILEWIQVSSDYRGRGLGRFVVSELLWRMKGIARFATVSGRCNSPSCPEKLYRKCGFTGNDVWHVLHRK